VTVVDEKDLKRRPLPGTVVDGTAAPLGDGHNLLVDVKGREVREVDSRGSVVRGFRASDVRAAVRLPSGNLMALIEGNKCSFLREVDRDGKVVWQVRGGREPRSLAVCLPLVGLGF
jgi:hypothetical protein